MNFCKFFYHSLLSGSICFRAGASCDYSHKTLDSNSSVIKFLPSIQNRTTGSAAVSDSNNYVGSNRANNSGDAEPPISTQDLFYNPFFLTMRHQNSSHTVVLFHRAKPYQIKITVPLSGAE